jgi:phosphoglycolate phosphatase-like HAD superfamily hydrolase
LILGAADAGELEVRGKAAMIEQALQQGRLARPAVLVGDRAEDIRAAKACGLASVAVAWGNGGAADLNAENPDYLCGTVSSLRALMMDLSHA